MDWTLAFSLAVPAVIVVTGWLVVHRFAAQRDLANRRREQVTSYLLEAYRKLEKSSNPRMPEETWDGIESAIADIQLLGSPEQAQLAVEFAQEMGASNQASTRQLLILLRKSLRVELDLPPIEVGITHLRFDAVSPEAHRKRLAEQGPDYSFKAGARGAPQLQR